MLLLIWINKRLVLRRFIGGLVAFALVAGVPGSEAYRAAAQTAAGRLPTNFGSATSSPYGSGGRAGAAGSFVRAVSMPTLAPAAVSPTFLSAPSAAADVLPAAVIGRLPANFASGLLPNGHGSVGRSPTASGGGTSSPYGSVVLPAGVAAPVIPEAERVAKRPALRRLLAEAARLASPVVLAVSLGLGAATLAPVPAFSQPSQIEASAVVEPKAVEIGGEVTVTLTLKNPGSEPVALDKLREALEKAAPRSIAVRGVSIAPGSTLAPGQSLDVKLEVQLRQVNEVPAGGTGPVNVAAFKVEWKGGSFTVPALQITGKAVLPENWKDGDFNPLKPALVQRAWDTSWWVAVPLALLGWIVARRVRKHRAAPGAGVSGPPTATDRARKALRLIEDNPSLPDKAFYAQLAGAVSDFLSERLELARHEGRTYQQLLAEALSSGKLSAAELAGLERMLGSADVAVFAGAEVTASARADDLAFAHSLVEGTSSPGQAAGGTPLLFGAPFGLFPSGVDWSSLELAAPEMLALALVFLPLAIKFYLDRRKTDAAVIVSTLKHVPKGKTWRQRLSWIPKAAIGFGMLAAVFSVADPHEGALINKMIVPVVKVLGSIDRSGSMEGLMEGSDVKKIDAAVAGERVFLADQRMGAANQIAIAIWDSNLIVISPFTTDPDANEAALANITIGGGTDADKAIRQSVNLFLKRNIVDIDESQHPEAAELKKAMWTKGLNAALEIFFKEPKGSPLWNLVVRPDQGMVIRFPTDGDSAGDPIKAAYIAQYFGIKIHTIGIPASDLNKKVLIKIAEITGGRFALATDPQALADIHLAISKEIKTPVAVMVLSEKSHRDDLALLAFAGVGLGLLLPQIRLRYTVLAALAFGAYVVLAPLPAGAQTLPGSPAVAPRYDALKPYATIPELKKGRELNAEGKHREAILAFLRALERYPHLAEIRFDIGTAFLGLEDVARGEQFLRQALEMAQKTGNTVLQGQILYQLAWASLIDRDAEGADILLREALGASPNDLELKENAERLQRMIEEQQKEDKKDKGKKGKKGKKKSSDQKQRADQRRDGQKGERQPGQSGGEPGGKPGQEQTPGSEKGADKPSPEEIAKQLGDAQKGQEKAPPPPSGFGKMWSVLLGLGVGGSLLEALPGMAPEALAASGDVVTAFGWNHPALLLVTAVAVPVIGVMMAYSLWQKHRKAKTQVPLHTAESLGQSTMGRREFLKRSAQLGGLALYGGAAGGPWSGLKEVPVNFGGGHDVVVLLGVSNSDVHAEDGRFNRALTALDALLKAMGGKKSNKLDRITIVPVAEQAGEGALTTDYTAMRERLYDMRGENFNFKGGSLISRGILKAFDIFESAKYIGPRQRVIIIVFDGGEVIPKEVSEAEAAGDEDLAQARELNESLKAARAKGIRIYPAGIGSVIGSKMLIPAEIREKDPSLPMYIQKDGKDVYVKLNKEVLDKIAHATDGKPLIAESGRGLEEALHDIARLERSRSSAATDTVKVKNPLSPWFLIPGTLLLGLAALIRARPGVETGQTKLHSFGAPLVLLGLAGSWTKLLPDTLGWNFLFSVGVMALLGLLLIDVIFGGRLLRRLAVRLDDWGGLVARGVASDGAALLVGSEGREIDAGRLADFIKRWQKAGWILRPSKAAERRRALLAAVKLKDDLWREKLVAAYLSERSTEMRAEIQSAMAALDQKSLAPLSETLDRVLAGRPDLSWLRSDVASARLADLFKREDLTRSLPRAFFEELADSSDAALRAQVRNMLDRDEKSARPSWRSRLKLKKASAIAAIGALLLGSVAWNAAAVNNIMEAAAQRHKVQQQVSSDFFGGDAYLLTQPYADQRIVSDVIPVLKRWSTLTARDAAKVNNAIAVLSTSTDAKAENLMLFLFRQRVIYTLGKEQQSGLIRMLIERSNAEMLTMLVSDLSKKPTPTAQKRYEVALSVLSELKGRHNYMMLVQLLIEESPAVSEPARQALGQAFKDPKNAPQVLDWLKMSIEKLGKDPALRLAHVGLIVDAFGARKDLSVKDAQEAGLVLSSVLSLHEKSGTADEISEAMAYRREALGRLAKGVDELGASVKDNTKLRELLWGALSRSVSQIFGMGDTISPSNEIAKLSTRNGLKTVMLDLDMLIKDGRFYIPPGIQFGISQDYLVRYHLAALRRAQTMLADQLAKQAGADQIDFPEDKGPAYLGGAVESLKIVVAVAQKLGVPEQPETKDSLSAFVDVLAAETVAKLNGPFHGQTWREFITGSADASKGLFVSTLSPQETRTVLARMEQVAADGRLVVPSRPAANVPLDGDEKKALALAIEQLKSLQQESPRGAVINLMTFKVVESLMTPFFGLSWTEFVTGSEKGVFPARYTVAELERLILRAEQLLSRGELDFPSRVKGNATKLTNIEKEKLDKALVQLRILLAEKKLLQQPAAPAPGGATLRSSWLASLVALAVGSNEPLILTAVLGAMLIAGLVMFFRLGLHRPRRLKPAPAPSSEEIEQRWRQVEVPAQAVADSLMAGALRSKAKGSDGVDYIDAMPRRPGQPGGSRIAQAATARTGVTHYQILEQERDMPVMLFVDRGGSLEVGTQAVSKRRVVDDAAGAIARAASQDRTVGMVIFTDRVERVIQPRSGREAARELFEELIAFKSAGRGSDLKTALESYGLQAGTPRSLLVPVSDFLAEGYEGTLASLSSGGHTLMPVLVEDRFDSEPAADLGEVQLKDAVTGTARWVDTPNAFVRRAQKESIARARQRRDGAFEQARARVIRLSTDGRHLEDLIRQSRQHQTGGDAYVQ